MRTGSPRGVVEFGSLDTDAVYFLFARQLRREERDVKGVGQGERRPSGKKRERPLLSVAHPLRSSRWIYGGSRAFYTLASASLLARARNYLIITLNACENRYIDEGMIYIGARYAVRVRENDGIYYGLVCVFKRQSPSPVRTTAIWSGSRYRL